MELLNKSVLEIATAFSGASRVFYYFQIDLCAHRNTPLKEMRSSHKFQEKALLEALRQLPQAPQENVDAWQALSTPEFIDKLISHYHQRHRTQLPEIIRLARHLYQHCRYPPAQQLAHELRNLEENLEQHMDAEEQELFPQLRSSQTLPTENLFTAAQFKHSEHERTLQKLEALSAQLHSVHQQDCAVAPVLYKELERFFCELRTHIYLEDDVLMKRFY